MYRNARYKRGASGEENGNFKSLIILSGSVLVIAVIAFIVTYSVYKSKSDIAKTEYAGGTNLAKTSVNVIKNDVSNTPKSETKSTENVVNTSPVTTTENKEVVENKVEVKEEKQESVTTNSKVEANEQATVEMPSEDIETKSTSTLPEEKKEPLTFIQPVEGEIIREFAKDNLVFSKTLDEWITHLGIDIKANKTTVVKAVADGKVESIKNDPRYGLTVVVVHDDGFKTIYSNLLTAEFVVEGEEITSGQTIGTVGNNASFEISDEPHLHFEMQKDNEKVDPKIYIKFD